MARFYQKKILALKAISQSLTTNVPVIAEHIFTSTLPLPEVGDVFPLVYRFAGVKAWGRGALRRLGSPADADQLTGLGCTRNPLFPCTVRGEAWRAVGLRLPKGNMMGTGQNLEKYLQSQPRAVAIGRNSPATPQAKASSHLVPCHRPLHPPTLRWFNLLTLELKCTVPATPRKRFEPQGAFVLSRERWAGVRDTHFGVSCHIACSVGTFGQRSGFGALQPGSAPSSFAGLGFPGPDQLLHSAATLCKPMSRPAGHDVLLRSRHRRQAGSQSFRVQLRTEEEGAALGLQHRVQRERRAG
ncbi:PREDICTED: uncharacterized protein LOC108536300 [Rhinopithecus bieti]|uniref:uncharacterized protein LOC108536300 n=1 Tax=Rhinopithecus bieti TaxID=61621 RepID=UPI00083C16C1|nr:PREDICTED: uncharacterized protein LOC108536300 [Rhinopithecus bieti]